jgi:hypothetical protein
LGNFERLLDSLFRGRQLTVANGSGLRLLSDMSRFAFLFSLFAAALLLVPSQLMAGDIAPVEKAKIEALIAGVEGLADAKFSRNGSSYDAKTAAKFLRGKWGRNEAEIKTAADFIAKAATASGTSGKPYMIQLKGADEVKCADYLTEQLRKLEAK